MSFYSKVLNDEELNQEQDQFHSLLSQVHSSQFSGSAGPSFFRSFSSTEVDQFLSRFSSFEEPWKLPSMEDDFLNSIFDNLTQDDIYCFENTQSQFLQEPNFFSPQVVDDESQFAPTNQVYGRRYSKQALNSLSSRQSFNYPLYPALQSCNSQSRRSSLHRLALKRERSQPDAYNLAPLPKNRNAARPSLDNPDNIKQEIFTHNNTLSLFNRVDETNLTNQNDSTYVNIDNHPIQNNMINQMMKIPEIDFNSPRSTEMDRPSSANFSSNEWSSSFSEDVSPNRLYDAVPKKKKKAESANDKTKKETFKRDPYKCQYCGELKKNHQCEAVEKVVIRDFGTQTIPFNVYMCQNND